MDLFSYEEKSVTETRLLADRMRPMTLDEYVGQEHIIGPGKLLRRAIEADQITSLILYGPPGCGKTTLAHIISLRTEATFIKLNAVDATVKDVRAVIEQAANNKSLYGTKTILFLDEVHRFNTSRQDALLPAIEQGTLIFIGATTENPFHHVNGALLSRSTLFQLEPLRQEHAMLAMERALADRTRGLAFMNLLVDDEALDHIAAMAGGDIRRALNALELAAITTPSQADGSVHITLDVAQECVRKRTVRADTSAQYDVLSAFHKSVRGSSDAALYWFFYAVEKLGMDPMTFLRRLIVACSEDIGLANPQAMIQAVTAMDAYHKIGWPEAKYNIAQAILFAVESPKSNTVATAIAKVSHTIEHLAAEGNDVPLHLRDTHYSGAAQLGHEGYKYPHDYPNHYVKQQYLPNAIQAKRFYEASEQGTEAKIKQNQKNRNR
ncbi:replication-associated recombination protein A [Paenibacillus yanchengensis]|uniref:Replication-associated recombination protein A n=1 Tax=Paenibacillus yanchengensis TaxID=2035833 RepID=A0ABW4YL28_9BACL